MSAPKLGGVGETTEGNCTISLRVPVRLLLDFDRLARYEGRGRSHAIRALMRDHVASRPELNFRIAGDPSP